MRWLVSLGIALLTAVVGLLAAGVVASLAVDWYRISSFEGGSGYFVIAMALLGGIAGFVIGVITSLVLMARSTPGFLRGLGASLAVVLGIAATTAGIARFLADVPPTMNGEELHLVVELRWPAGTPAPPDRNAIGTVTLGALSGQSVRASSDGPLFFEDARQEEGRWIVPGVVSIFTSRGRRSVQFQSGTESLAGFVVPLPGRPGEEHRQWSAWLPADGAAALPTPYSYRFKVVRLTEPFRRQRVGRFEVTTASKEFFMTAGSERRGAHSTFSVLYDGSPIAGVDTFESVAVVGGEPAALIGRKSFHSDECVVFRDVAGAPNVESHKPCWYSQAQLVTGDAARAAAWRTRGVVPGWLDAVTFAERGLYQLGPAVMDTRTLAVTTFEPASEPSAVASLPPLGLSPDERSFAWFSHDSYRRTSMVAVTDWTTSKTYALPVDRARMRFVDYMELGPAWLHHHFEWQRGADGRDVLVERKDFVPLSYVGKLTLAKKGESQLYWLEPGGERLRDAIVSLLVDELKGERLSSAPDSYEERVKLDDRIFGVSAGSTYVTVSLDAEHGDPDAMQAVARRLEASFATGRFDALFVSDEPAPEAN
jgi:hypothetical protein